jgi:hypothetical protein
MNPRIWLFVLTGVLAHGSVINQQGVLPRNTAAESGGVTALKADHGEGAATVVFADSLVPAPEPATFLLIGGGLLVLGGSGRKARRRRLDEKETKNDPPC